MKINFEKRGRIIPAKARLAMKMFIRDLLFLVMNIRIRTVTLQTRMNRNKRHRKINCSV